MPPSAERTTGQRAVDRERAQERQRQSNAGIVKVTVKVPAERIPELNGIALRWRQKAQLLCSSDQPSTVQILRIHAVSRVLRLALPVHAFETRLTAESWLATHKRMFDAIRTREFEPTEPVTTPRGRGGGR